MKNKKYALIMPSKNAFCVLLLDSDYRANDKSLDQNGNQLDCCKYTAHQFNSYRHAVAVLKKYIKTSRKKPIKINGTYSFGHII